MKFVHRRIRNFTILGVVAVILFFVLKVIDYSFSAQQFYSGWLLLVLIIGLLAFYVKKRLSVIPLGPSAIWAQWHYYTGLLVLLIFIKHVDYSLPDGIVEVSLFVLFIVVIMSGIGGAIFNRVYAKRLGALGEEVIFERIPQHRQALHEEVEKLLLDVVEKTDSDTLSSYYLKHLMVYFDRPKHIFSHLIGSGYATLHIQNGLEQQMRYLNGAEAECAVSLKQLIHKKDILDRHLALQGFLKYWGVLHFPVSLCMCGLTILHIILVYAFGGGR